MTLRDKEKTFLLPKNVKGISYEDRIEEATKSSVVISASSSLYHTFSEKDKDNLVGKILIDIAFPPDMHPLLAKVNLECALKRERKKKEEQVLKLAEFYIEDYFKWVENQNKEEEVFLNGEKLSSLVLLKLNKEISELNLATENEFREKLFETIRKTYINFSFSLDSKKR